MTMAEAEPRPHNGGKTLTTKIMVAPRSWTKIGHRVYVFFSGTGNTWVEYAAGNIKFGAAGKWAIHRGPVDSLPTSWNQVTERRTVKPSDIRS